MKVTIRKAAAGIPALFLALLFCGSEIFGAALQVQYMSNALPEEQVARLVTELKGFASQHADDPALNADDPALRERVIPAYDAYYDSVLQDGNSGDNIFAIFSGFLEKFQPRSPIWRLVHGLREELTTNYSANRAMREMQHEAPTSSSSLPAESSMTTQPAEVASQAGSSPALQDTSMQHAEAIQPQEPSLQSEQPAVQPAVQPQVSFLRRYAPAIAIGVISTGAAIYAAYKYGLFEKLRIWKYVYN